MNNGQAPKLATNKHLIIDKNLSRKAFSLQSAYKQINMPTHKRDYKQAHRQTRKQIGKQARAGGRRGRASQGEEKGKGKH